MHVLTSHIKKHSQALILRHAGVFFTLLIALASFLVINITPALADTKLLGVRFGPDGDKTRIVLDLDGAPEFDVSGLDSGKGQIILDFTNMTAGPEGLNGFRGKGHILQYRYGPDGTKRTRFYIELKKTARIEKLFILEPKGDVTKHRLVVDLRTADKAAFLASLPNVISDEPVTEQKVAARDIKSANKKGLRRSKKNKLGDKKRAASISDIIVNETGAAKESGSTITPGLQLGAPNQNTNGPDANSKLAYGGPNAPRLKPIARRDDPENPPISLNLPPAGRLTENNSAENTLTNTRSEGALSVTNTGTSSPINTRKLVIVIDPGHGGSHPGAIGATGKLEKDINLAAAKELSAILNKRGQYQVIMTRNKDEKVELDQRAQIARNVDADLFISIHADGNDNRELRGSSVYTLSKEGARRSLQEAREQGNYRINNGDIADFSPVVGLILYDVSQDAVKKESARLAELLLQRLGRVAPLVKNAKRTEDLKVLLRPDVPAILLEMAFISNKEDEKNLSSPAWRARTMGAVATAIDEYFKQSQPERFAHLNENKGGIGRGAN